MTFLSPTHYFEFSYMIRNNWCIPTDYNDSCVFILTSISYLFMLALTNEDVIILVLT